MKACKPKLIICYGGWNIKSELGRKGFKVEGKNLVRKGVRYHMPRSIERALKKGEGFAGNFKLVEEGAVCLTKKDESKINSLKEFFKKPTKKKVPNEALCKDGLLLNMCAENGGKPKNKYILTDSALSFFCNGKTYQSSKANPMFQEILNNLKVGNEEKAIQLCCIASAIDEASDGIIKNDGGTLAYQGQEIADTAQEWILNNLDKGKAFVQPIVNFLRLAHRNPSKVSIDSLWRFIRKNGLIITSTGEFIGYKYLKDDFYDRHTGKHFNGLGSELSMDREAVCADINKTCSQGYHVACFSYTQTESTIVECLINPYDVVSCPINEEEKLRVCRYRVWKILRHKNQEINPMSKQLDFFLLK